MRVIYSRDDGEWTFNLIDTPGHVDFAYEVSRAIAACEGALLIVDASQGIQAQTLANLYLAMEHDLEIIPVLNKIDLPIADVPAMTEELVELLGVDESDILKISAKTGESVTDVLDAVVDRIPAPETTQDERAPSSSTPTTPWRSPAGPHGGRRAKEGRRGPRAMGLEERFEPWRSAVTSPAYSPAAPARRRGRYVIAGLKDIEPGAGDTAGRASRTQPISPCPVTPRHPRRSSQRTIGDDFERLRDALFRSCSSMMPRSTSSQRTRRWGSGSGVAFSGSCTWRSCRSG